ncbi:MAG: extracellular solute-binding protein [Christensenellales bacterium]|jgi:putative aldouronate transport system substrate-binding protein
MKLKRMLAMALAIVMMLIFASCTTTPAPQATPTATTGGAASPAATSGSTAAPVESSDPVADGFSYPMEGNPTLTWWMGLTNSAYNDNNANLPLYKALMEQTGVTIEFQHPTVGQEQESFNLMLAGGTYPDIIEQNYQDAGKLLDDGIIIDLTDLYPQYAPNLYNWLQENPNIDMQTKNDDGQYLLFGFYRPDPLLQVSSGPIVRLDFLEKLNINPADITTIDEWTDLLIRFRDELNIQYPFSTDGVGNTRRLQYAFETGFDFFNENGTIEYGILRPGYRDFLELANMWHSEGLLDPNYSTNTKDDLTALWLTGKTGLTYGSGGSYIGQWITAGSEDPDFKTGGLTYPVLNEGDVNYHGLNVQFDFSNANSWFMISSQCQNVEAAMRLLDYGYSEEGHILYNFGVEGESFEYINGEPIYLPEMFNHPEYNLSTALAFYVRATGSGPFQQDPGYILQYYEYDEQKEALGRWAGETQQHQSTKLPPIVFTTEASTEVANIMSDIKTYIAEEEIKFIMGTRSLDTFDDFIAQIKSMNIDRAIELYQAALNKYYER